VWRVKDSNLGRHQPTDLQVVCAVGLLLSVMATLCLVFEVRLGGGLWTTHTCWGGSACDDAPVIINPRADEGPRTRTQGGRSRAGSSLTLTRQARRRDGIPASAPPVLRQANPTHVPLRPVNHGQQWDPMTPQPDHRSRPLTAHQAQPSKLGSHSYTRTKITPSPCRETSANRVDR
jgi:hypothetical protein